MIIWFTGQPGAGKSTLAQALAYALRSAGQRVAAIDGEEVRHQTGNLDFSEMGRLRNVRTGQQRAVELEAKGFIVVASFVSPQRAMRDTFKRTHDVLEIYAHTSKATAKDVYHVPYYEPPLADFLDMNTTSQTIEGCVRTIIASMRGFNS